jgi:hypothetical protein
LLKVAHAAERRPPSISGIGGGYALVGLSEGNPGYIGLSMKDGASPNLLIPAASRPTLETATGGASRSCPIGRNVSLASPLTLAGNLGIAPGGKTSKNFIETRQGGCYAIFP